MCATHNAGSKVFELECPIYEIDYHTLVLGTRRYSEEIIMSKQFLFTDVCFSEGNQMVWVSEDEGGMM